MAERQVRWLVIEEKKRVYVFDVFDVFACLRFSLKVDFIINVSDVFDVFSVFSISPPKN